MDSLKLANAVTFGREAVEQAERTQNDRLIGKAHTWLGLAIVADPEGDVEEARRCRVEAQKCFGRSSRDYAKEDFLRLGRTLTDSAAAEAVMRSCIEAALQGQTREQRSQGAPPLLRSLMQRIEEEIVLAVYKKCGRSMAKTSVWLGTGFDQVKNVLGRRGLGGGEGDLPE